MIDYRTVLYGPTVGVETIVPYVSGERTVEQQVFINTYI